MPELKEAKGSESHDHLPYMKPLSQEQWDEDLLSLGAGSAQQAAVSGKRDYN